MRTAGETEGQGGPDGPAPFLTPEAADEALTRFAVYYDYHRLNGAIGWQTPAERWDGTPFIAQGFEHVPALEHLQGWLTELMAA